MWTWNNDDDNSNLGVIIGLVLGTLYHWIITPVFIYITYNSILHGYWFPEWPVIPFWHICFGVWAMQAIVNILRTK